MQSESRYIVCISSACSRDEEDEMGYRVGFGIIGDVLTNDVFVHSTLL